MTESTHGLALVRRAAAEHRRLLIGLGIAVLINVGLYAFVVAPLADRVANVAERDRTSELELARARAEHAEAAGVLTGKSRASAELTTFYSEVLPRDLTGARRLTYLSRVPLASMSSFARAGNIRRRSHSSLGHPAGRDVPETPYSSASARGPRPSAENDSSDESPMAESTRRPMCPNARSEKNGTIGARRFRGRGRQGTPNQQRRPLLQPGDSHVAATRIKTAALGLGHV